MSASSEALLGALIDKGVIIHAPGATYLDDLDPERIEAGVEIFPGTTLKGRKTLLRAGASLGRAGGGYFEDIACGAGVDLYGGYFKDAVFLDKVIVRGHSEMRGGTLMEEGSETGHHVGYKMTITLPNVVAGSLINFCDALIAGGTSRVDHTEIGSALALYNFTPWGDKFASRFGDIPRGVFLRSPRIFIGGQTQVVSPIHVGYGALVPAGAAVRRSVPEGILYAETTQPRIARFDPDLYGGLGPKFSLPASYVGNLWALLVWYRVVRSAWAGDDPMARALYLAGEEQIEAGIAERVKRLSRIVGRLPASFARHQALAAESDEHARPIHERRMEEHRTLLEGWNDLKKRLSQGPSSLHCPAVEAVASTLARQRQENPKISYIDAIHQLSSEQCSTAQAELERVVASCSWGS